MGSASAGPSEGTGTPTAIPLEGQKPPEAGGINEGVSSPHPRTRMPEFPAGQVDDSGGGERKPVSGPSPDESGASGSHATESNHWVELAQQLGVELPPEMLRPSARGPESAGWPGASKPPVVQIPWPEKRVPSPAPRGEHVPDRVGQPPKGKHLSAEARPPAHRAPSPQATTSGGVKSSSTRKTSDAAKPSRSELRKQQAPRPKHREDSAKRPRRQEPAQDSGPPLGLPPKSPMEQPRENIFQPPTAVEDAGQFSGGPLSASEAPETEAPVPATMSTSMEKSAAGLGLGWELARPKEVDIFSSPMALSRPEPAQQTELAQPKLAHPEPEIGPEIGSASPELQEEPSGAAFGRIADSFLPGSARLELAEVASAQPPAPPTELQSSGTSEVEPVLPEKEAFGGKPVGAEPGEAYPVGASPASAAEPKPTETVPSVLGEPETGDFAGPMVSELAALSETSSVDSAGLDFSAPTPPGFLEPEELFEPEDLFEPAELEEAEEAEQSAGSTESSPEAGTSDEHSQVHRGVPTWKEVMELIISTNLQARGRRSDRPPHGRTGPGRTSY